MSDRRSARGGAGWCFACLAAPLHPVNAAADRRPHAAGIVGEADSQALASLIYGSLAEATFWIANDEDGKARLARGMVAQVFLLRRLLVKR